MAWGVPTATLAVAGLAVTPRGRPLIETLTAPMKPLTPPMVTTAVPVLPEVTVRVDGLAEMVKSTGGGGGVTAVMVSATDAEWLSEPEVAVKLRGVLETAAADGSTVRVTA